MPMYLVCVLGDGTVGLTSIRPKQGIVDLVMIVFEKGTFVFEKGNLLIKVWNGLFVAILGVIARVRLIYNLGLGKRSLARLR